MKKLLLLLLLSISLTSSVYADFDDGLRAALNGDFETAYKECQSLAEQGDAEAQKTLDEMLKAQQLSGSTAASNPEKLAEEYFNALQNEGMMAIGRFMHPNALVDFKSMILPVYEMEAQSGKRDLMNISFGSYANISTLRSLDPVDFFNGFMNFVVWSMQDVKISFDGIDILGVINEGDTQHVLSRITVGAGEFALTSYEVLSFDPIGDSWGMQLTKEYKGFAESLKATMSQ